MTNNNLTLDKWRKELNKHLLVCGITVASPFFCRFIRNFIKKLLSLQYQKDIEQFKNMESMKKEKKVKHPKGWKEFLGEHCEYCEENDRIIKKIMNIPTWKPQLAQSRNGIDYCATCEQAWDYCSCSARNGGREKAIRDILQIIQDEKMGINE